VTLKTTRREFAALLAAAAASAKPALSRLSVESYIFQQYAQRLKKPLGDVLDEIFPMTRQAGFTNIELNQQFLTESLREKTLALVRANGLSMPSVYGGGAMHERALADATIADVLALARICRDFGCTAVVHNPKPKPAGAEKTDEELRIEAESLDRMGHRLADDGFQLRVHNHTPEMVSNAREFRNTLAHTDPKYVAICLDIDWVYQGGMDPYALLREAGRRVTEIHARNSNDKLWLESFGPGDLDYGRVVRLMREMRIEPLVVVELAWRDNTVITRNLEENLRMGREYAEKVFGLRATRS
jgi:inosose dehydratase